MAPWIKGILLASRALAPVQTGFSNQTIANVRAGLLESAKASWELGTAAEALTEVYWPALSVFQQSAFPPPSRLNSTYNASDVLTIVANTISNKPADSLPLIANQGSAADPASIGVAVLLANYTRQDKKSDVFADAATGQLRHLLTQVPRSNTGAISHREDQAQLWADFVSMVPPFIAYYGALQGGQDGRDLMQTAYDQCRLYRDALKDDSGLWRHIALGNYQDNTHWATGNAWAAAGMLRVLQTFNHSSQGHRFEGHQTNLTRWIGEITDAAWARQQKDGSILNVIDDPLSFADTASTALLASVTYRMATFNATSAVSKPVLAADKALAFVKANIDKDGWVQNAVDPIAFNVPLKEGEHSPESQAFVLMLHAAYRDWQKYLLEPKKPAVGKGSHP